MITNGRIHYEIIRHIIDKGYAPDIKMLSEILREPTEEVVKSLNALAESHGVVLHPNKPDIWIIHPFSLAPTNFLVRNCKGVWWGNCAWCSLGVAALLDTDVTITTRLAGYDKQITINIKGGEIVERDLLIHFPIPMRSAWDNVVYTCSNMLIFESEPQVEEWSRRHNIPKGDIQSINRIWEFSREWYGNHLNQGWEKWTMDEAKAMFAKHDLKGDTWNLEANATRF
jgi:hypothetical protein